MPSGIPILGCYVDFGYRVFSQTDS